MASCASRRKSTGAKKSRSRIPDHSSVSIDKVILERSKQLIDIGLTACALNAYRVNALYDFSYEELIHYEKKLADRVVQGIINNECDSSYKSMSFIVKIQHFPNMVYCERDNPPIKITISTENEDGFEDEVFVGYLLSVERNVGCFESQRLAVKAIILPLFLVRYESDIFINSVMAFLEDNFSSVVTPLKFSSVDLIFMLFLFSSPDKDKCTSGTMIKYQGTSKDFSGIEYFIDHFTASEVWKRVAVQCTDIVNESDAYEFISAFEEHFFKYFSIDLKHLELDTIKTPLAVVTADQLIKVRSSPKLFYVLRHITHLAQE